MKEREMIATGDTDFCLCCFKMPAKGTPIYAGHGFYDWVCEKCNGLLNKRIERAECGAVTNRSVRPRKEAGK